MHGSLPAKLRVLRARQGLTLIEAAEKIGIGRDTLSDLERGNRHPVMPTLAKIAQGYGVPVEELLEEPALAGKAEAPTEAGPTADPHEWARAYSARLHGMSDTEWDVHIRALESVEEIEQELRTLIKERENLRAAFDVNKGLNPEDRENRISLNRRLREIRTDRLGHLASAAAKKKAEALFRHVTGEMLEELEEAHS
jgi:transcriptional regulator with XRE-family HTH domain